MNLHRRRKEALRSMTMSALKKLVVFFVLAFGFIAQSSTAWADFTYSVEISNPGSPGYDATTLSFSMRPTGGVWDNYQIGPGEIMTVGCNCDVSTFEIFVKSEGEQVNYTLSDGHKYTIEWKEDDQYWEVFDQGR
jgi:hypothetical protein